MDDLVKFAQQKLKESGFDPGPIDGVDGDKTRSALQKYNASFLPPPIVITGKYREIYHQTPNYTRGKINERKGVIFHHSSGNFEGGIDWILKEESKVSYHCLIDTNGTRCSFAPDEARAWHAGSSEFRGRAGCNDFMLGVSFTGDTNHRKLTEQEIESVLEWIAPRWKKYNWSMAWMTDHRTVSPGRKDDLSIVQFTRLMEIIKTKFT